MSMKTIVLSLASLAFCAQLCTASIGCYECGSLEMNHYNFTFLTPRQKSAIGGCTKPIGEWDKIPCESNACYKAQIGGLTIRGCGGSDSLCDVISQSLGLIGQNTNMKHCSICHTDSCNSATDHTTSLTLSLLPALVISYYLIRSTESH